MGKTISERMLPNHPDFFECMCDITLRIDNKVICPECGIEWHFNHKKDVMETEFKAPVPIKLKQTNQLSLNLKTI